MLSSSSPSTFLPSATLSVILRSLSLSLTFPDPLKIQTGLLFRVYVSFPSVFFFLTIFISSFYFRGFFSSHLCLSLYLNMRFLTEWVFSGREQGLPTDGLRLCLA